MRVLTEQNVADLIRGSSVFSTGGGYVIEEQEDFFDLLMRVNARLELADIKELNDDDFVCTCYILEPIDGKVGRDIGPLLEMGMNTLSRVTGKRFAALFAGEINIEGLVFTCAAQLGIPVLDADCTGGRAVPEITYDDFCLHGKSLLPAVGVTLDGDCFVLETVADVKNIEAVMRGVACSSPSQGVIVFDHPISVREAREVLSVGTLSRSIRVGAFMRQRVWEKNSYKDWLDDLVEELEAEKIACGRVTNSSLKQQDGFYTGEFSVRDESGKIVKIWVKNENMLCWRDDEIFITVPDLVVGIDTAAGYGLHNSCIGLGRHVAILGIPSSRQWNTPEGKALFGPRSLGFDFDAQLMCR